MDIKTITLMLGAAFVAMIVFAVFFGRWLLSWHLKDLTGHLYSIHICKYCLQEFRLPFNSAPAVRCPGCGGEMSSLRYEEKEEEIPPFQKTHVCEKCHAEMELVEGDKAKYCPCCGEEL